jgi:hypothetical protein
MSPLMMSCIIFGVIFAGSLIGIFLQHSLPGHHVADDSKSVVQLVMGLIATMAALVLGLLIASAKSSYDTQNRDLVQLSAQVIQLDRFLSVYGPEARDARARFHAALERGVDRIWPSGNTGPANLAPLGTSEVPTDFYASIANLNPQTNVQRIAQSRALEAATDLSKTRVLMFEESGSSIPLPFVIVLVFWLVIIFMAFGLFAPTNATVVAALCVGALSVAGALFLILELDRPYEGLMHLSDAPLRAALAQMAR